MVPLTERALRDALPELISHLPTVQHAFALVDALVWGIIWSQRFLCPESTNQSSSLAKGSRCHPQIHGVADHASNAFIVDNGIGNIDMIPVMELNEVGGGGSTMQLVLCPLILCVRAVSLL